MPRKHPPGTPRVVYRTARCGLRATCGQRQRLFGLLRSAGDVWCCVLELNAWRRHRQDMPLAGYKELCRELAASGPGTFAELDTAGARSVLRRYSDAWFSAAKRRKEGDKTARFPRRRRALVPIRWYAGTFRLRGRVLRLPTARGCPPVVVRLDRDLPYPADQVRSVTLLCEVGRLWIDVTAEVPVVTYPEGEAPNPDRAGRGRPGDHPPVCRGRAGRAVAAGVGARDPGRVPPTPARREGPRPRRRPASTQAWAARVAALAAAPPPPAAGGGPTQAANPAGTARGCKDRGQVGDRAPGRHAGGRRSPRRSQPGRRAAAQPAGALLARWVSDYRAARQGRGGRDNSNAGR
jgi:hypothetical protein